MSHSHRSQNSVQEIPPTITFYDQLKFALEHIAEPAQLGKESPLAQPYFLGHVLENQSDATTSFGRGTALCNALEQAVNALWEGPTPTDQNDLLERALDAKDARGFCDQYHYLLLDLTYFHTYFPPPSKQSEIYRDVLHVSRATYDRHLREAIRRLSEILLLRLQPTLHTEQPVENFALFGRDEIYQECVTVLQQMHSVYLCGTSGIGKTALGAALAEQWPTPAVFWFTIRVTLNDQLTSLLFALGNFLHKQGASRLWLQLIANAGVMKDANLALELARADLADLSSPLLCFDEIDLLRPLDLEAETVQHTQFLAFIDGLQGHAALLFMGQRPILSCDFVHRLARLAQPELAEWLTQADINFSPATLARLDEYTAGNPRLVALSLVLYRALQSQVPTSRVVTLSDVLDQLPQTPALGPIWQRLQQRLERADYTLLQSLSVFRSATPRDAWSIRTPAAASTDSPDETEASIERLLHYRLIQKDKSGGITLLPSLRDVIYSQLTVERREDLHSWAGMIRAERGEYTAAAYHYYCAGQPEVALALWEPYYDQEVRRGQAAAALAVFEQISGNRLSEADARTLRLLRGRLYQLEGDSAQALAEIEPIEVHEAEAVDAATVGGDAFRTLGQTDAALGKYGDGLAAAARLLQQSTWLHAKRGTIYMQQRELNDARREALHARYCLENLEGTINEITGNYGVARQHYLNALNAAELLEDKVGLALVQRNLGVLAAHQDDEANAIRYHQTVLAFYEEIGDRVNAEEVRSNLAGVYVQFKNFTEAITPAQKALKFFSARQNTYWIAQNTSNLATVYFELGDFALAQQYAERTLEQEEPQSFPYALFTLGQVHNAQGREAEATAHFGRVRQIAQQTEDHFLLSQLDEMMQSSESGKNVDATKRSAVETGY